LRGTHKINWIIRSGRHQIFLRDEDSGVRPADVSHECLEALHITAPDTERR